MDGRPGFERILHRLHADMGRAHRVGVTGPPGAGKSTLTSKLALEFRGAGEKIGIVAVDPSSPFTGGALLGHRFRMNNISTDPGIFIRSMATRGGGREDERRRLGWPWTALGYTYNWHPGSPRYGASEYLVRGGTQVVVTGVIPIAEYCGRAG